MTDHEKASAIASKLRNIRIDAIVTAKDILAKCSGAELDWYYRWLCK